MDVGVYPYPHSDPLLIDKIVNEFLSQGKFDKLRKECMSDADTKPAYQNLQQRVENTVTQFLRKQVWRPDLNKNQLRDSLRKHILESKFFDAGINRIVDQVVNPNVLATVFLPEVEEVVYNYLSIPRPYDKNQKRDDRRPGRDYDHRTSQESHRYEKYGRERVDGFETQRRENFMGEDEYRVRDTFEKKPSKDYETAANDLVITESPDEHKKPDEKIKSEPGEETQQQQVQDPGVKAEFPSDESQESLNQMAVEGLRINESDRPPVPDSDDSVPLEINEKSMSESRDSEDSIMNQMSPISQGRLTPDLEEEIPEQKTEEKPEQKLEEKPKEKEEEKKPMTFIGRIPKIKREDSDSSRSSKTKEDILKKDKLDVKNIYSSDESDSSKSYGKSDSDERRRKSEKSGSKGEKKQDEPEKKHRDKKRESSKDRKSTKEKHRDHKRERSRERHKKSSSSSSSSQRERSSSHHKSSHRHKDSKSKRKEEEKKKSKNTDDHGKEKNKKEDRRSTDRDSNERERGRSTGGRNDTDSKKREKEQQKTEDVRSESNQNEEPETEKESGVASESEKIETEEVPQGEVILIDSERTRQVTLNEDSDNVLDFNELFQVGALSRLEFPKLTDDFYVKFNSTGFRYFEEWEKTKLDCEVEFKEFVDEAENDLSLLSDDDSDFEFESSLAEENKKTIKNLLRGLSNFRRSLMFDPQTSEFYKWTNTKFYHKYRKKGEKRGRSSEKNESDESIKENIDRGERNRALHLKLINKYRRKAMRMGKPRRRQRKPDSGGIKEKNENRSASGFFDDSKTFLASRVMKMPDCSLVESENSAVPNSVNSINSIYGSETVTLPESPEENEEWSGKQKNKEAGKTGNNGDGKLSESLPLNLPPSPDSDDVNSNNGIASKNVAVPRKRMNRESDESATSKKQTRRNYSQKYDSQDLYKPRPILHGSRTRGRDRGLERDIVGPGDRLL